MARILALIPARGGSKRLPRKNVLNFLGRPLVQWSVLFARQTQLFDRVVISTDDSEIMDAATAVGASNAGLRPDSLAHDSATSIDVALHELNRAEADHGPYDLVALLQPTSPFRFSARWHEAKQILDAHASVTSVIGVAPADASPYHMFTMREDKSISPLFPEYLDVRTQDLPRCFSVNGSLYLVRADVLRSTHSFFHAESHAVLCDDPRENIDIDTLQDFEAAKTLLKGTLD